MINKLAGAVIAFGEAPYLGTHSFKAPAGKDKMNKQNLGRCQFGKCSKEAKYGIFKTYKNKKEWLYVCPKHDEIIGLENLRRSEK